MKVNKNLKSYENSCSSKKDSKSEYSIKQMEASFHEKKLKVHKLKEDNKNKFLLRLLKVKRYSKGLIEEIDTRKWLKRAYFLVYCLRRIIFIVIGLFLN